jgi:hypothetical protein
MTRQEWRELGFFYDRDDTARCWRVVRSKKGLSRFADVLHGYAADAHNEALSEHAQIGPYMYLKVMTWSEAGVDRDSVHGTLDDLRRLVADEMLRRRSSAASRSSARRPRTCRTPFGRSIRKSSGAVWRVCATASFTTTSELTSSWSGRSCAPNRQPASSPRGTPRRLRPLQTAAPSWHAFTIAPAERR